MILFIHFSLYFCFWSYLVIPSREPMPKSTWQEQSKKVSHRNARRMWTRRATGAASTKNLSKPFAVLSKCSNIWQRVANYRTCRHHRPRRIRTMCNARIVTGVLMSRPPNGTYPNVPISSIINRKQPRLGQCWPKRDSEHTTEHTIYIYIYTTLSDQ